MTLEEALEKSGTANLVDDKTLQATKELIEPNEEILYALYTKVDFMNLFGIAKIEPLAESGIIVILNNRILFSSNKVWEINNVCQIQIKDIKNIEQRAFKPFKYGFLLVFTTIYRCRIQVENKEQLDNIKTSIKMAQTSQGK